MRYEWSFAKRLANSRDLYVCMHKSHQALESREKERDEIIFQ